MIVILTVYSPLMVKIPAKIGWMPAFVCKNPVMPPASAPQTSAAKSPRNGCPATLSTAETAAPSVKLPSTVRSGILSTRKVI